ncbi:MAG: molybdopterin-dependent oxidoreductase [Clostridiales bacterium]|jgi:thiosulfate reductase/polysulfide reductase chain A|nr:molybdopterin-dependent oxidoreductase [Clostridiales bacterium]
MQISRRHFIGVSAVGVLAAGAAAAGIIGARNFVRSEDEPLVQLPDDIGDDLDFDNFVEEREAAVITRHGSFCNACSSHCGMWIYTKNGRVWKVRGHEDHNRSRGKLCARAHGHLEWVYGAARVRTPLKRTPGGGFEAISWEQATQEIGDKLREVIADGDAERIFWGHNPRQTGVFYGTRFMHALGSSTVVTHNAACNTGIHCGFIQTIGRQGPSADRARSNYLMMIGRNYGEGIRTAEMTQVAGALKREGTKTVCVDPRLSATAALADEWIPIRPGTDMAFILGMCNVLVSEDLYDREFIDEYAVGFDRFLETIGQYTPEWAEEITTIPADTIRRLAREMAAAAPTCFVDPSWKGAFGANYANCSETTRTVAYINALLGTIGRPGGLGIGSAMATGFGNLNEDHPPPAAPTVPRLDGAGRGGEFPFAPIPQGLPHNIARKAIEEPGSVRVGFIRHFNPVRTFPDYYHMKEGFEAFEMLVVMETHMTETAMCADYILPECTFAEREEVVEQHGNTIAMRTVAIDKVHPETKPLDEIVPMLAEAAGVGEYFRFTLEELNTARLAPLGISMEEMRERGAMTVEMNPNSMNPVRFYNEDYVEQGFNGVAQWTEPATGYIPPANNQFRLLNVKQGYHSHAATANVEKLGQITIDYNTNRLWMNTSKAAELGINDNDWVEVSSPGSETFRAQIYVTQKVHPDALVFPGGYGNRTPYFEFSAKVGGVNPNDLVPFRMEPISGHAMLQEAFVTVRRI